MPNPSDLTNINIGYDISNLMAFAGIGLLLKLFIGTTPSTDGTSGPATAAVWGYGIIVLSLAAMLIVSFALASREEINRFTGTQSSFAFIGKLIKGASPIVLTLGILIWLMAINITYYKRINEGDVASEFNQFSALSTMLLVFQLIILFKYLTDKEKGVKDLTKWMGVMGVLTMLNLVFVGMMQIVVEFFSTDG